MKLLGYGRILLTVSIFTLQISISSANEGLFKEARTLQREGHFDDAIAAYKNYLSQPVTAIPPQSKPTALVHPPPHKPARLTPKHPQTTTQEHKS
jgi:hypothetical protein